MKYFAIWGKNQWLSLLELQWIWKNIVEKNWIFFFDTDRYEDCKNLAWFTKVWHIITLEEFVNLEKKLVWTNIHLNPKNKKKYWIKRYKQIDLLKSDLEIKRKWIEAIFFKWKDGFIGIVDYYQNISLYENIDFEKPVSSMNVGMMPSKLAHLLVNISTWLNHNKTIYDPFVGLGTTMMVANYLWNNTIWSDLNPVACKQNWKFWQTTEFYKKDCKSVIFKQDVTQSFKNKMVNFSTNIVSEWFLGPVVWKYLNEKEASFNERSFQNIYIDGIKNLLTLPNIENIVITFPVYFLYNREKYFFQDTYEKIEKNGAKLQIVDDVYHRKWQKVWRQVVIITKS